MFDAHVKAYHASRNPFVCMQYSPKLRGKARRYGGHYTAFRVVETTGGLRPPARLHPDRPSAGSRLRSSR